MSLLYEKLFPVFYIPFKTVLKIAVCTLFVALILVPCVLFLDDGRAARLARLKYNSTSQHVEVKTILYWTGVSGNDTFPHFKDGELFRDCKMSACRATRDRNFMKIDEFHAILFHGLDAKASDLPRTRSPRQKYVFVDMEVRGNFLSPGGSERFKGKRKAAAWFVSKCQTDGEREGYLEELQKYIDIDIYGECGVFYCGLGNEDCYQMLERRYHFYIVFENSSCQDYVTEKLYKAMAYEIVPIVYGAVNYSQFLPPGSYINVLDFRGPIHLAKHLKHLVNSPEEYRRFFWWKKHFFLDLSHRATFCKICEMLHDPKTNILDFEK